METIKIIIPFEIKFLFKSYYVVWKQKQPEQRQYIELWFKSYYVVWKPRE